MLQNKSILVLGDDTSSLDSITSILEFIGENAEGINADKFLNLESSDCELNNPPGLVLINGTNRHYFERLARKVKDLYQIVPIAVLEGGEASNDENFETSLASEIQKMVVAKLSLPLNYNGLNDAIHRGQLFIENLEKSEKISGRRPSHLFRSLVGTSRLIKEVRRMMMQVAENDVTVLIQGESGTGKEVVARNLHYHSARKDGPFVPVNCGAIPQELLESELFGHEKGAFTGAINARAGRFELAEGGTLFLDEIGDMPLHMQVKILRVLQEKTYERVGGNKSFSTNVRIIAATHRNLEEMIEKNTFREDLYYRLNVFPIDMPALRERSEDIPLLINELVARLENEKRGSIRFNSAAILSLCRHSWAGNVRELANLVERMAIMHPFGVVSVRDLPQKYRHVEIDEEEHYPEIDDVEPKMSLVSANDKVLLPENGIDLKEFITGLEQSLIQQALDNTGGVVARAAEQLMIRRTTLVEKMKKYGLQRG